MTKKIRFCGVDFLPRPNRNLPRMLDAAERLLTSGDFAAHPMPLEPPSAAIVFSDETTGERYSLIRTQSGARTGPGSQVIAWVGFLLRAQNFTVTLEKAVVSSWPVIVLYHLYAGLAGLIQYTNVGQRLAGMAAAVSGPYTYLTAAIASVFAFFISSSGGQWAIQGFITSKSAIEVGVSVERGLLAMSVGDHMGNLTSPFWYVVIPGIAHLDFRIFFGYGLVFAASLVRDWCGGCSRSGPVSLYHISQATSLE
jgi:hypothetical protein